jgi:hypothetical protein
VGGAFVVALFASNFFLLASTNSIWAAVAGASIDGPPVSDCPYKNPNPPASGFDMEALRQCAGYLIHPAYSISIRALAALAIICAGCLLYLASRPRSAGPTDG